MVVQPPMNPIGEPPYPGWPHPWQPFVSAPRVTVTTTGQTLRDLKPPRVVAMEDLLRMAYEELICSDDEDALALCELIEEQIDVWEAE